MTNQPYDGDHEGYDPYRRQAPQGWPAQQQPYEDPQAAQQYTQQWQGQTWETQVHQPVTPAPAEETAYLPSQNATAGPYAGYQDAGQYQDADQQGAYASGYQTGGWDGTGQAHAGQQQAHPGQQHGGPQQHGGQQQHLQAQQHAGQQHIHAQQHAQAQPQMQAQAQPQPQAPQSGSDAGQGDQDGYGPATLAGNSRITDAQRARQEGRSPIIEPGMQPAGLTALLGLLLAGAAAIGSYALLVPLVALQAVTAAGWFRLNGMWPARQGIALAFAGAVTADIALLASDHAPAAILGTLGVWVLLTLVLQLRSHADPDERMYGLMATVASAALSIVAAGYLAAEADAVTVGAVAVAVAVVVRALPLPTPASVAAALLAGVGAGAVVGAMTGVGSGGALLGGGAALCALIGHRAASYDYPSRFVHFTAGVALPLAAAAPAVYVLGRALG
ncbi:hypothetical protein PGH47_20040 [Streptomyces sp. HUAS 31]|uniref:hypothetical protein n=1 Tax=Streptomyces sp. HUAS 31 TaxID=3020055 RepID=UPI0023054F3B|nr:hypothetical protein [Streptomyces sp. HUAS 31]WCD97842.1 hypothetical protein PGH47_20040 [Streptomyces sp. HUAS 31]